MVPAGDTRLVATGVRTGTTEEIAMQLTEEQIKAMTDNELHDAASRIQEVIKEREEGAFAEAVRYYLAELAPPLLRSEVIEGGGPVSLSFGTDHWDDGFFYDEGRGTLVLADGTNMEMDFGQTGVHDALTQLSSIRRIECGLDRYSRVTVDLLTGEVEHDVVA